MTSVNVTTQNNTVTVQQGDATTVTVTTQGPQGATGAGISAGDKGSLTVAANLTDWTLNDNVVTSAKIVDGAIVNADINASAAIAGSKISPTFTSNLTVSGTEHKFTSGTSGDCKVIIEADTDDNNEADNPLLAFRQDGSVDVSAIGHNFSGGTGSGNNELFIANSINQGGIVFYTGTTSGFTNGTERLRIANDGQIDFAGNVDCNAGLDVTGDISVSSGRLVITNSTGNSEIEFNGAGPNFIRFTDNTNSAESLDLVHRTTPHTLAIEKSSDATVLFSVDRDDGQVIVSNNLDVGSGLDVTGDIIITGNLNLPNSTSNANGRLLLGDDTDIQLYHDSTTTNNHLRAQNGFFYISTNNLRIVNSAITETFIKADQNGAVILYHDNEQRISTESYGSSFNGTISISDGDLILTKTTSTTTSNTIRLRTSSSTERFTMQHTGGNTEITNLTGNLHIRPKASEEGIKLIPDGSVELYNANVKKLETSASGTTTQGNVFVTGTAPQIRLNGDSNDSSTTRAILGLATSGSQFANISTANDVVLTVPQDFIISHGTTESMAIFKDDSSVQLHFDGTKKFETSSSGIIVQGSVTTQDMNMSNLNGTANEVDSTKGSWSIQEGADDLFLINRVSGKKYKFNLTEIS